uniref:Uncharacterized protein n=1 Tax=Coccidioides posadasii RMSCC 3488 TaxID=454284 RepID=A0A0J6IKN4_COCPO|nr:hypothetical protein CPAG_08811 [Coccidioides posadasii RMSCC 3488]
MSVPHLTALRGTIIGWTGLVTALQKTERKTRRQLHDTSILRTGTERDSPESILPSIPPLFCYRVITPLKVTGTPPVKNSLSHPALRTWARVSYQGEVTARWIMCARYQRLERISRHGGRHRPGYLCRKIPQANLPRVCDERGVERHIGNWKSEIMVPFAERTVEKAQPRTPRDPANPARSFPLPKRVLASHVADSLSYGTRSKPVAHSPPRPPNRCVVEVSAYTAQSFRGIKFQTVFTNYGPSPSSISEDENNLASNEPCMEYGMTSCI